MKKIKIYTLARNLSENLNYFLVWFEEDIKLHFFFSFLNNIFLLYTWEALNENKGRSSNFKAKIAGFSLLINSFLPKISYLKANLIVDHPAP